MKFCKNYLILPNLKTSDPINNRRWFFCFGRISSFLGREFIRNLTTYSQGDRLRKGGEVKMIQKIASVAGGAALLLGSAVPAFAWGWHGSSADIAIVDNAAVATANTGGNTQGNVADVSGGDDTNVGGNNGMTTGNASASAGAVVVANTHVGSDCDCVSPRHHKDFARVRNAAVATANTGGNTQGNVALVDGYDDPDDTTVGGNNSMTTGSATSRAKAFVLVNTHWSR